MASIILVTGGAGYIGSHCTLALLEQGYEVVVLDDLSNGSAQSLARIARLCGREPLLVRGDVRDRLLLKRLFQRHAIFAVLHFAGLKAVAQSVTDPLAYYDTNFNGTLSLCRAMAEAGVYRLVFSSSATVYGTPDVVPVNEDRSTLQPINPYGRTKLAAEWMLADLSAADPRWRIAVLRYFNPVGAHESGLIGEDPQGIPNNLVPYLSRVAVGLLGQLPIFGQDYATHDGTGVRDYIHVQDLVEGHLKALQALHHLRGQHAWNLGSGHGYSVLEVVSAFERASGRSIACRMLPRRAGDIAACWADVGKSARELGWKATRGIDQMMADAWRWQSRNPRGYPLLPEGLPEPRQSTDSNDAMSADA